jgi:hypothetical protein
MTQLVESLPDRSNSTTFGSINFGIENEEEVAGQNAFTYRDKENARKKNWYLW